MVLNEGYGFSFAFAKDSHWASANTGMLHIWQGYSLVDSYAVPGFLKGNLLFEDDVVYVGLFRVPMVTKSPEYLSEIAAQLAAETKANYSQYKTDEIFHAVESDLTLVAVSYQPPKGLRPSPAFSGPTNRLLLFRRSDQVLLRIIAENFDQVPYNHLMINGDYIIFTVDGYHTRIASVDQSQVPSGIPGFSAFASAGTASLIGAGAQRILCYDVATARLLWQSPDTVDLVNAIASKDENSFVAAVNDHYLQYWKKMENGFVLQSVMDLKDVIAGIAIGPMGKYFVALAGAENYIEILDSL